MKEEDEHWISNIDIFEWGSLRVTEDDSKEENSVTSVCEIGNL